MMFGYAPHRQMLPLISSRIWSAVFALPSAIRPAAEQICRTKIDVISGQREAELTALGVVSGFHRPDGIVGDLGGGSLELVDVHGSRIKPGTTLPLGGLALQDRSGRSIKKRRQHSAIRLDTPSETTKSTPRPSSPNSAMQPACAPIARVPSRVAIS